MSQFHVSSVGLLDLDTFGVVYGQNIICPPLFSCWCDETGIIPVSLTFSTTARIHVRSHILFDKTKKTHKLTLSDSIYI